MASRCGSNTHRHNGPHGRADRRRVVGYVVTQDGTVLSTNPGEPGPVVAGGLIFPVSLTTNGDYEVLDNCNRPGWSWTVPPPDYLTERQRMIMATDPVMIRQTARLIADELGGGVEVAADVRLSFNGRMSRQFTDPEVVISEAPLSTTVEGFILAQPAG
jgi:Vitamin K-dependent gamma-carboxylase